MNGIHRIIQRIQSQDRLPGKVIAENRDAFAAILNATRGEILSLPNLRIDVYKVLSVYDDRKRYRELVPIQGKVVTMKYTSSVTGETTEITAIEEVYPKPFESAEAAEAAQEKIDRERYETKKQEVTDVIADAIMRVLIDELVGGTENNNESRSPQTTTAHDGEKPIQKRNRIVREEMKSREHFRNSERVLRLAGRLDREGIKYPVRRKPLHGKSEPKTWSEAAKLRLQHPEYVRIFDGHSGLLARRAFSTK